MAIGIFLAGTEDRNARRNVGVAGGERVETWRSIISFGDGE